MYALVKNQYVLRGKDQDCVISTYIPREYFDEAINLQCIEKEREDVLIDSREKATKETNEVVFYGRYTSGHRLQLVYTRAIAKFISDMMRSEKWQDIGTQQIPLDADIIAEFGEFFSIPTGFIYSSGTWNYGGIEHFLHAMNDQPMSGEKFDITLQLNMIRISRHCYDRRCKYVCIPHAPAGRVPTYIHFYAPGELGEIHSFGEVML